MNIFVSGMTGSGKSYAVQSMLRNTDLPIIATSNKIEDFYQLQNLSGKEFLLIEVHENTRLIQLPRKNIFFSFGFITHDKKIKFMDDLALHIMQQRNMIIYIDEAHEVLGEGAKYSKQLESLVAGGRARHLHVIIVTQRPQNVRKSVINNCKWRLCFKTSEKNSVKAMVQHMEKISEDDIRNLQLYEFYKYNAYTGQIKKLKL